MATLSTITREKTRTGKGIGTLTCDAVDFGILTGDVTFTEILEETTSNKGSAPQAMKLVGSRITSIGANLKFKTSTVDNEQLARVYGAKYLSNVTSRPIESGYIQKPVSGFAIEAKLARYLSAGTPVADVDSALTGDGVIKTFSFTITFTGKSLKPGSISIHDELDVETLTDSGKNGKLTSPAGGTGTVDYYTGAVVANFYAAVANTKKVQSDHTPLTEYEEIITFYCGEFVGAMPPRVYGDAQMELDHQIDAVWDDDRCSAANGLWKIARVAV